MKSRKKIIALLVVVLYLSTIFALPALAETSTLTDAPGGNHAIGQARDAISRVEATVTLASMSTNAKVQLSGGRTDPSTGKISWYALKSIKLGPVAGSRTGTLSWGLATYDKFRFELWSLDTAGNDASVTITW